MLLKLFFFFSLTYSVYASSISYLKDIHPILEKRCAVCHSCYNAPCQLKMEAFEGLDRGGSKNAVYMATRLRAQDPTRLFMDALTTQEWRGKEFFSVTDDAKRSTLYRILDLKNTHPKPVGNYHAESEETTCVKNSEEMDKFIAKHPNWGMPYGFPPLKTEEFKKIEKWLNEGAKGPTTKEQLRLITPSNKAALEIQKWELFLNQNDPKHQVTARYIYEHFFLAHIRFGSDGNREFYELVRSSTLSGPIKVIATVRPYDDPKTAKVYYRFRKIHATITYKTHMVVQLDDERLDRYRDLFIVSQWDENPHTLNYDPNISANPLVAYKQIPPMSRYKFLLDHAQYIVDTFIKGPVCKGQLALNVIEDHFWVMFMDPNYDPGIFTPHFYEEQEDNLRIPDEEGSDMRVWNIFTDRYLDKYLDYFKAKTSLYDKTYPNGLPLESIWKGERPSDAPFLSVYRHFDSASVHRGAKGEFPKTAWVMDYAQFERTYYALVAGFDVFGNISHQTNIRRFMDYIRKEGELNFVHYMPKSNRFDIFNSWYSKDDNFKKDEFKIIEGNFDTKIEFMTNDPHRELIEKVLKIHLNPAVNIAFDPINYFHADEPYPVMPKSFKTQKDYIQGFRALMAPGSGFIRKFNEFGVDIGYIRIRNTPQGDRFIAVVVNRWHNSVNTLFKENSQLDPSKDTLDFFETSMGSYPNYFFDVDLKELPDFFDLIQNYDGSDEYKNKLFKYGVNRSDPDFWEEYDWFQSTFNTQDKIEAGLYDLNRYYNLAL